MLLLSFLFITHVHTHFSPPTFHFCFFLSLAFILLALLLLMFNIKDPSLHLGWKTCAVIPEMEVTACCQNIIFAYSHFFSSERNQYRKLCWLQAITGYTTSCGKATAKTSGTLKPCTTGICVTLPFISFALHSLSLSALAFIQPLHPFSFSLLLLLYLFLFNLQSFEDAELHTLAVKWKDQRRKARWLLPHAIIKRFC